MALVAGIATCLVIYFSTGYQFVLSNMYRGYKESTTGFMVMYVYGLTFWVRQYIRAKVEARCGLRQACVCHPWTEQLVLSASN